LFDIVPKKVATIEAVFSIDGMGTVIALPNEEQWELASNERIHRGERIQIRTRSGVHLSTFVKGIEMINRGREKDGIGFSLPRSITPQNIPDGSELWLERDGIEPLIEP
jgi:translation elongation factor EF-Tu-like GTPase